MPADYYPLNIEQGAAFELELEYQDADGKAVNLTGWTGKSQVREEFADSSLLLDFKVTLGGTAGTIIVSATASQTDGLTKGGQWDLFLTPPDGEAERLVAGPVEIERRTTDA